MVYVRRGLPGPAGRPGIGLYTASDITGSWTYEGIVIERGADGTYDGTIAASLLVVHDGSTFHMLYESSPDDAGTYHTSYASSSDGINWTKSSNNPITTEMEVVDDFMVEGGTGYYTSHNVRDDGSGSISRLLSGPGDPANWETGTWTEIGPLGVSEGDSVMFIEGDTARVTYQPPDGSAIELFDWGGASPLRPYVLHMDLDDPNGLRQGVESGIYDITPHIVADTFSTGRVGGGVETANAEAYEESRIVSRFRLMGDPGRPGFLSVGSGDVIPADDNGTPIHYWPTFTDGYMIGVRTPDSSDGMVIAEISAGAHTTLDQTTLSSEDAQAWAVYETHIGQNGALAFVRDDVEELSASDTTHSPPHQVLIGHGGYQTHRVGYECDYVFVTKLVDSEPSVTFGTEEDTSGVETRSITTAQASATAGALTVDVAPQARSIASATAPASAATLTADPTPQTRSISAATALASTAENAR